MNEIASKVRGLRFVFMMSKDVTRRRLHAAVYGLHGYCRCVKRHEQKGKRAGDNKLLVSATRTSEARIHGGRCVPSELP